MQERIMTIKKKVKAKAKKISAFIRRKYKSIAYYAAVAAVLAVVAAAAENYRTDREGAQMLVLPENMAQEVLSEMESRPVYPQGMLCTRIYSEQLEWNGELLLWENHAANDYVFEDSQVICLMGGTVSDVGESSAKGGFIVVEGADGRIYRYCSVKPGGNIVQGKTVAAGEVIALADDNMAAEHSQGKHLHLEVYNGGDLSDFEKIYEENGLAAD